jgi:hypothetical protein
MFNPFEKFADNILHRDKKGQDLKKYSIDLNGVLGKSIDNKESQHNENRKLVGITKICLMNKLHFWINKTTGVHSSHIAYLEHDIKQAATICDLINQDKYTKDDITKLRNILQKHNCL